SGWSADLMGWTQDLNDGVETKMSIENFRVTLTRNVMKVIKNVNHGITFPGGLVVYPLDSFTRADWLVIRPGSHLPLGGGRAERFSGLRLPRTPGRSCCSRYPARSRTPSIPVPD